MMKQEQSGNVTTIKMRIGTPFCVTYDYDSLEDKKVTVRHRDTMEQERVAIDELVEYITWTRILIH